jgi:hypothetical protein
MRRPCLGTRADRQVLCGALQGPPPATGSGPGYRSVAALLAAEARPGDTAFDFSTPTLSVKLSLPPPHSITEAALLEADEGSLQYARMVRTDCGEQKPLPRTS